MIALEFGNAWALALLLLVPPFWLFLRARDRRRRDLRRQWLGPRAPALSPMATTRDRRERAARPFAVGSLAALVLALAGPRCGEPEVGVEVRGQDLVLCFDVSRSMRARDLSPDRMEALRRAVAELLLAARGDRIALVAFAGEARLCVPLTTDLESLGQVLATIDELAVARGGTDLGAALAVAQLALVGSERGTVFVLTDGDDLDGRGLQVARRCAVQEVAVHCVAFGSERGSKIPVASDGGETYLRDRSGAEVVSAIDPRSLRAMAVATGGEFVLAADVGDAVLVELWQRTVRGRASAQLAESGELRRPERFQWALALAVGLWLLGVMSAHSGRAVRVHSSTGV